MNISVGIFFGGRSVEHEVSVISAQQAIAALDRSKYTPVPVYLGKDGRWFTGPKLLDVASFRDLPALRAACTPVTPSLVPGDGSLLPLTPGLFARKPVARLDAALVVMHGTYGEDGCLQGVFEMMGLPYSGCDVAASALGMDKVAAKRVWSAVGLPVVPFVEIDARAWFTDPTPLLDRVEKELGFPVVVKPSNLGSSVGLNTARDRDGLRVAVEDTARFTHRILVERMVTPLREINCSVLGDADGAEASVCEEPVKTKDFLSFADKYEAQGKSQGMTSLKRELPARISPELTAQVREHAARAFTSLRCAGVARIDFLYHEPTGSVYVNEINTIPGSLSFYLWEASGLKFPALIDRLLDLAFKRRRDQEKITFSYDTNLLSGFSGGKAGQKAG
jgi:D-alanine-D-alanine ligase